jgi:glycosyltransferase involved in cell wall biosynthesis
MKILFLYAEYYTYLTPLLELLTRKYNCKILFFHWKSEINQKSKIPSINNVEFVIKQNIIEQFNLIDMFDPNFVVTSGWMDKNYLSIIKKIDNKKIPIIAMSDTQWVGNIRQYIASFISPFYHKKFFSHIWVAGQLQFNYASRLGFHLDKIIFNSLSANTSLFHSAFRLYHDQKRKKYPQNFLFVGSEKYVKGLDILIKVWSSLTYKTNKWQLLVVGTSKLKNENGIKYLGQLNQNELFNLVGEAGCLIVPSRREEWGLIIHEFASAGLPILSSKYAGANKMFLINGYNGFEIDTSNNEDIIKKMKKIMNSTDKELLLMGEKSHELSKRITTEISAASLMSVFK